MGGYLTKQAILGADDRKIEEVHVPEWTDGAGADVVLVRGLDGTGRDDYYASMADIRQSRSGPQTRPNIRNAMARLVALCIIDPEDEQRQRLMFTSDEVTLLGRKGAAALARVEETAMRLSGLSEGDINALGEDSETQKMSAGSTSS